MRITIVQGAFLPVPPLLGGAVEKMWFGLAPEFVRAGHEVVYISRRFESLPHEEVVDGIRYIRVPAVDAPGSNLLYRALDFLYAWRVRRRLPPADILITNTIWLPVLIRGERFGKLCVHVARYPKGQMRLYRHAARLQTVSHAVAAAIDAEYPAVTPKVKVIPCYLSSDPPALADAEITAPREPWILYLGRIHPEKGLDLLVAASGRFLAETNGNWRLKLAGPTATRMGGGGEAYKARLEAACAGFAEQVDWLGFMGNAELNAICRRSMIFVYPSVAEKGESFGLAPLEAMSQGCVSIVSDLACFRDFITDDVTGLVFDHRSPDPAGALGAQLRRVAGDGALRQRLALAGYGKAREFTKEKVAAQYLADFDELLQTPCSL
jgi:glycosyltransferase involved in cell wall biosynthesis